MRLFEDPAEMDRIKGLHKPTEGFQVHLCQMVTQARWYGFTLQHHRRHYARRQLLRRGRPQPSGRGVSCRATT